MEPGKFTVFHLDDGRGFRGGQRQTLSLARELSLLGQRNTVVCRENSPLSREAAKLGLRTFHLPYIFEWDLVSASRLVALIRRECGAAEPRVILHAHTSHAAAHAWLAGLRLDCIRIVHRRVIFPPGKGLSARLKYGGAAKVIAISRAVKDALTACGVPPGKIALVASSVNPGAAPWLKTGLEAYRRSSREKIAALFGIKKDDFWTGSLMALDPSKDPLSLVRSARAVLAEKPGTQFLLAGKGKMEAEARALAKSLGLEGNFHFLGHYPEPYELLTALDLFVLPSLQEGLGSVLLEAMTAGVPIVATVSGGIPDVVENGKSGLLVPVADTPALAAAQLRLMKDPGLARDLAAAGGERLAEFSSARMAERTLAVYAAAAGQ